MREQLSARTSHLILTSSSSLSIPAFYPVILFHLNFNPIYGPSPFVMPWAIKQFIQRLCEAAQAIKASAGTHGVKKERQWGRIVFGRERKNSKIISPVLQTEVVVCVPNYIFLLVFT